MAAGAGTPSGATSGVMMFLGSESQSVAQELLKRIDPDRRIPGTELDAADIRITDFDGLWRGLAAVSMPAAGLARCRLCTKES